MRKGSAVGAVRVRPCRPDDRGSLERLNIALQEAELAVRPTRRVPDEGWSAAYVEEMLATAHRCGAIFVAEDAGGQALGFVACRLDEDELENNPALLVISDLVVAPEARGRGVARDLTAAVESHARRVGVGRIKVSALTGNAVADATYRALGFTPMLLTYEREVSPAPPEPPEQGG